MRYVATTRPAAALALSYALLAATLVSEAAVAQPRRAFTRADTLRGSIGPDRAWWDVVFYDLHVAVSPADSSIRGRNAIAYRVLQPGTTMQIDLQLPLQIDSVVQDGSRVAFRRDSNAFFLTLGSPQPVGQLRSLVIHYHGKPKVARNPPWDGGLILARDSLGGPWIATANQGLGASVWWPTKDTQADEPDSQRVAITVPDPMINVSNGRLRSVTRNPEGTSTYEWFVASPINNYGIAINAGRYAHFADTLQGEGGRLTMDFWPLAYHLDTARVQFRQATTMLRCFEHWFGPFPWYADGFKMVETPHLGMEHQSAVAYGNGYRNGYRGRDLSGTGRGLTWDFIIVHEAAHEWWGNNITTKDVADMWVHESFGNYSEGIYQECLAGKAAGAEYIIGSRRNIRNDAPIIGPYGVNQQGSGDMYYKGGSMLHMIRQIVGNDERWRGILRGLNRTFGRQTVTGQQVQDYISREAGRDLSRVFAQYLTTTRIPVLEYAVDSTGLRYRWADVVPGFDMPVRVSIDQVTVTMEPGTEWQHARVGPITAATELRVDPDFYVRVQKVVLPGSGGLEGPPLADGSSASYTYGPGLAGPSVARNPNLPGPRPGSTTPPGRRVATGRRSNAW
jgi:aminopeptidase N